MTAMAYTLVQRATELSEQHGRSDLTALLGYTRRRLADPTVRILVVGEFKQGKSLLVNALVNAPICAVDDDIATAVPTEVGYGAQPRAMILVDASPVDVGRHRDAESSETTPPSGEEGVEEIEVAVEQLARHVVDGAATPDGRRVLGARAYLPRTLLREGLVLVDTPGVGGLSSPHAASTTAALPTADAVLLVSDSSSEFTAPELDFLRQALAACPTVACVLSKTDLNGHWRRIREVNLGHLQRAGLELPIIPVSSTLRLAAAASGEQDLNTESGFPALVSHLRDNVLARRDEIAMGSVRHDLRGVVENLRLALRAELQALEDPTSLPQVLAGLTEARTRADDLKRRSARWQVTLSDGTADLTADLDHDLRDRLRVVTREAEAAIDQSDPGEGWAEFSTWLEKSVAACLADTFLWADRNAQWLIEQVGAHFVEASDVTAPDLRVDDTRGLVDPVGALGSLDPGEVKTVQKLLIGMRGSYGGVLMFGLITGFAGLAIVNPISVGAGLILGSKAYKDDAQARLQRRRAEAKVLVRRYVDDVTFQVGKQLRDRLRLVQRTVRDHYTEVAERVSRSLADSVATAQKAARSTTEEREARLTVVKRDLARLDEVMRRAEALSPQRASEPATPAVTSPTAPGTGPTRSGVVTPARSAPPASGSPG